MGELDGQEPFDANNVIGSKLDKLIMWHGATNPTNPTNKVPTGGFFLNTTDSTIYENTGTLASPTWTARIGKTTNADDIVSGTMAKARISTTGTWPVADIPSLNASIITAGTFNTARIPNLAASKITSGRFDDARMAQSNYAISAGLAPANITVNNGMAGIAHAYTPSDSGIVLILVSGDYSWNTSTTTDGITLRYGTGTAPAHNATLVGTQAAATVAGVSVATSRRSFSMLDVVTGLSVSTAYWFDLAKSSTSINLDLQDVTITTVELR